MHTHAYISKYENILIFAKYTKTNPDNCLFSNFYKRSKEIQIQH